MKEPEIIGFFIEGNNLVVTNPCKIPIEMLMSAIKKRKKGEVTCIGGIVIKLPFKFVKDTGEAQ